MDESRSSLRSEHVNTVRLVGRVTAAGTERALPSGDVVVTARVAVSRPAERRRPRQPVDALDCAAWTARARRSLGAWREGDVVEVVGAVRRRFYRTGGGRASRVEIEVHSTRLVRRAMTG